MVLWPLKGKKKKAFENLHSVLRTGVSILKQTILWPHRSYSLLGNKNDLEEIPE